MRRIVILFLLFVGIANQSNAQMIGEEIGEIWQSYYLEPDSNLIEKTINFFNDNADSYQQAIPGIVGFYGALMQNDSLFRSNLLSKVDQIKSKEIADLIQFVDSISIDTFYHRIELNPSYNDMNWASFFASGEVKYLDNIIFNIPYGAEREDMSLFLTGGSAMWSLALNAMNHPKVRTYLESLELDSSYRINELLEKEPNEFKEEMINIIKEQKAAGVWGQ